VIAISIILYALVLVLLISLLSAQSKENTRHIQTVARLTEQEFVYIRLAQAVEVLRIRERDYLTEIGNNEKWRAVVEAQYAVDSILELLRPKNTITYSVSSWHTADDPEDLTRE